MRSVWIIFILSFLLTVPLVLILFYEQGEKEEPALGQEISGTACTAHNGILTCAYKTPWNIASTTVCSIPSLPATSSIIHASVTLEKGTSSGMVLEIGKDTVMDGAVTTLASQALAAGDKYYLVATSGLWLTDNHVLAPTNASGTNFVNFKTGSAFGTVSTTPNYSFSNWCEVILRIL